MNNPSSVLSCSRLSKFYEDGKTKIEIIHGVDFALNNGDSVAITGSSGSGKTTLLNLLGGLDLPSSGDVSVAGRDWISFSENEKANWRNLKLGFIYQFHHLLPEFTALENVAIPFMIRGERPEVYIGKSQKMLDEVGLSKRYHHKPGELSGGERQRVAIARALVTEPVCVLADEPTGNLDKKNAEHVIDIILTLNKQHKTSFVIVTHDLALAARMDRQYALEGGELYLKA